MLTLEQLGRPRQTNSAPPGPALILGVDVSPLSILRMLWKRKLIVLLVWAVVTIAMAVVVQSLPAIYRASALIILDSQKIPERYVSATVNSDVQDRFATISQHILSASQIKKLVDQFHLYANEPKTHFPEEVLEMMKRDISITPEKSVAGNRQGAFRIAYEGPNPVIVAQVVNQIANLYIEENYKTREVQAEGTSEFLDAQLGAAKQKLDEMETAVSAYKVQHNGELPQQENSLNSILGRLQVELEANRDAINRAQSSKITLENVLGTAEDSLSTQLRALNVVKPAALSVREPESAEAVPERKPSERLRTELEDLRLRYSDEHPDVVKLRATVERVEAAEKAVEEPVKSVRAMRPVTVSPAAPAIQPVKETQEVRQTRERVATLQSQMAMLRQEIETRKSEQKRILADMGAHQGRIGRLPIREQEMAQITRDYDIATLHYRSLLDKKISAEMASDMERRQKAERFIVADPARVPGKPSRPNRAMFRLGGSIAGLILGLVLGIGREVRTRTLLGEWQVPPGIPVIGRLPEITHSSLELTGLARKGPSFGKQLARRVAP